VILHAGLIARYCAPNWRGVLIEGPSGSGKSDLALRAADAGWALVTDDRTLVWTCEGRLYGRAPETLEGLLEVRGLGILPVCGRHFAEISLIAACVLPPQPIERMPETGSEIVLGVTLPKVNLAAFEPSAPAKLTRALSHLGLRPQRAYQTVRARD
jgi:serine kinase of HPr protein (carbohydrate metabolism regulator)